MALYQGQTNNLTGTYDVNFLGLQVHNLQKQMNEYNNVITNQQQLLTELIDKRERDERNLNVHWPKIRDSHDSNGPKIAPPRRNEHTNPPPQRHTHNSARLNRYGQNDVRPQRQPSNRRPERPLQRPKLRDFLPHNNRQISVTPKNKKVNFSKDTSTVNKQKSNNRKIQETSLNTESSIEIRKDKFPKNNLKFSLHLANRFLPLASYISDEEDIHEDVPTEEAPTNNNVVAKTRKKKTTNLRVTVSEDESRKVETDLDESIEEITHTEKRYRKKPYLNPYKIQKWLKENAHTCTDNQKNTTAQGDGTHIKTLARFGYKAAPHIEKLTRAFFDIQVWQFYMELGTKKNNPHWAKEVIASAKTRDPTKTKQVCEQKILRFSEEIAKLTDKVDKIAIDTGLDKNTEGHNEIMFRYMNEMLSIVRRQHELKMKIARSERAEYVAWDQFLKLADATQKTQGLSLKAQLLKTREKYIRYEIAAAHATPQIDMLPKCLTIPKLAFRFDEKILTDEQIKDIYESMNKISREYKLKTTELYIRTAKAELDFHENRVKLLLEGSTIKESDQPNGNSETAKAYSVFNRIHLHHTSALADMKVLFLEENHIKDAPDPDAFQNLIGITKPMQDGLRLNRT
ncbi:unnamed protein product [Rotaria socialis]|uniref:Uncharacterized protein n=2 Tax=Rotaria TaxID=231623 RepID=A0A816TH80_9BILA|nr:unnamed protein product [Rotaria magnacalcarata]CAF3245781.1 unnamed protein product [Rotaria socialis]CAF1519938.1 unnamed protein product [Rotaria magnacalcarata]CAF2099484.1 unnamed protein product [Rotaria magnacalcarata]CAF3294008.1 unnamed protein product [Rotaria socialis]